MDKLDTGNNRTNTRLTFDYFGNIRMKLLKMGLQIGRIFPEKCLLTGLAFAANNFLVFLGVEDHHLVKLPMDVGEVDLGFDDLSCCCRAGARGLCLLHYEELKSRTTLLYETIRRLRPTTNGSKLHK